MSAITIFITTGSGPNQEHLKKKQITKTRRKGDCNGRCVNKVELI